MQNNLRQLEKHVIKLEKLKDFDSGPDGATVTLGSGLRLTSLVYQREKLPH